MFFTTSTDFMFQPQLTAAGGDKKFVFVKLRGSGLNRLKKQIFKNSLATYVKTMIAVVFIYISATISPKGCSINLTYDAWFI